MSEWERNRIHEQVVQVPLGKGEKNKKTKYTSIQMQIDRIPDLWAASRVQIESALPQKGICLLDDLFFNHPSMLLLQNHS